MRRPIPILVVLVAAFLAGRAGGSDPSPAAAVDALSRTQARAVVSAAPSMVTIRPAAGGDRRARSGVVVAPNVVATCATNVDVFGLDDLVVETQSGDVLPATLRGRDTRLRIVLLEVADLTAPPARRSAGPHPPGTFVLALGTPLGGLTATSGIISARGRFVGRAYQTDAELDGSNVGGALVDLEGRLIAISVHVSDRLGERSGVGFAIPIQRVLAVLVPLLRGFQLEAGRMGILVPRQGEPGARGMVVRGVVPRSAAARAGLEKGDLILSIEGHPTRSHLEFREVVADLYAGQRVVVEIERAGAQRKLAVTVEPLP